MGKLNPKVQPCSWDKIIAVQANISASLIVAMCRKGVKFGDFDLGHIKGQLHTWLRDTRTSHILARACSRMQLSNYCSHRPYQHSSLLVGPGIYGRSRSSRLIAGPPLLYKTAKIYCSDGRSHFLGCQADPPCVNPP